jgi:hypothetical protein
LKRVSIVPLLLLQEPQANEIVDFRYVRRVLTASAKIDP